MYSTPSKRNLGTAHRAAGASTITVTGSASWSDAEQAARHCLSDGEQLAQSHRIFDESHVFDVLPALFTVEAEGTATLTPTGVQLDLH